jgi:hypothetical protein
MIDLLSVPSLSEIEQAIDRYYAGEPMGSVVGTLERLRDALRRGDALLTRADREKAFSLAQLSGLSSARMKGHRETEALTVQARTLLQLQEPS